VVRQSIFVFEKIAIELASKWWLITYKHINMSNVKIYFEGLLLIFVFKL
jgi:hypothetical protein